MTEPIPTPHIVGTAHQSTTRRVHAAFEGPKAGSDLLLDELRTAVFAAELLPGHATVQVFVRGSWCTPEAVAVEATTVTELPSPLEPHACTDDCDPGNCAIAHALEFAPMLPEGEEG